MKYQFEVRLKKRATAWIGSIGETNFHRKWLDSPINFAIEGVNIVPPKINFGNGIFQQEKKKKKNLVIIQATDPMQIEREIIWLANWQRF